MFKSSKRNRIFFCEKELGFRAPHQFCSQKISHLFECKNAHSAVLPRPNERGFAVFRVTPKHPFARPVLLRREPASPLSLMQLLYSKPLGPIASSRLARASRCRRLTALRESPA
jgi:hypothetical protein